MVGVRVTSVSKSFPREVPLWQALLRRRARTHVLSDVSFDVPRGTLLGILGANGAGKSTLLGIIAGLIEPDSGFVELSGSVGVSAAVDRSFYFRLTLRENLRFFGILAGLRGARLDRRVDELLDCMDLLAIADRSFMSCSTGMRQRAMVAQSLLRDPDIILLDEPTRALDPLHTAQLQDLIKERLVKQQRKTVLFATNVLDEAWTVSDRVALFSAGKLIALDTPAALRERVMPLARYRVACRPINEELIERLGETGRCVVVPEGEGIVFDIEPDPSILTSILKTIVSNGVAVSSISREDPPAAAFFLKDASAHG